MAAMSLLSIPTYVSEGMRKTLGTASIVHHLNAKPKNGR